MRFACKLHYWDQEFVPRVFVYSTTYRLASSDSKSTSNLSLLRIAKMTRKCFADSGFLPFSNFMASSFAL